MSARTTYYRNRKFIGQKGYQPKGINDTVLQIMRLIIEGECMIFIPRGNYTRGGLKHINPNITPSPLGKTFWVTGYDSHCERFNFSFKGYEQVFTACTGTESRITEPAIVPRTINVIRDCMVVLPRFSGMLGEVAWNKLFAGGVLKNSKSYYESMHAYEIDLSDKRIASGTWGNPYMLGFVNLLKEKADLQAEEKILKTLPAHMHARTLPPEHAHTPKGRVHSGTAYRDYSAPVKDTVVLCSTISLSDYAPPAYDFCSLSPREVGERRAVVRERLNTVKFISRVMEYVMYMNDDRAIPWNPPIKTMKRSGELHYILREAEFGSDRLTLTRWYKKVSSS